MTKRFELLASGALAPQTWVKPTRIGVTVIICPLKNYSPSHIFPGNRYS